jgi:hypothetical protein
MELVLNLAWMVLAALMCWLWVRYARREGPGRGVQFIALALVLVAMFVLITMYDDMAMAQNPAETRCFQQREDELGAHNHAALHPVADLIPLFSAKPSFDSSHSAVLDKLLVPALKVPATNSIQNRPPPAAA